MITCVGNIEIVDSINGNARHVLQVSRLLHFSISSEASDTSAGNRYAFRYHHFTDAIIVGGRDEDIVRFVESNSWYQSVLIPHFINPRFSMSCLTVTDFYLSDSTYVQYFLKVPAYF